MPNLRPYQKRGIKHLEDRHNTLMFLPMGAGKTAICCRWIGRWAMRVLVVAPLRVAETVWPPELEMWAPGVTYRVVTGHKRKREKALATPADVTIVNYENLVWFLATQELDYDAIIFDELTAMKNQSSKRFKTFIKHRKKFNTFIGLTGTPTSNGIHNLYAQLRCIDGGRRLGKTLTAFRAAFMLQGFMQWDWKPRPGALQQITRRIEDITFTVTDEEYADQLPPLVVNDINIELPSEVRRQYNEILKDFITDFGDVTVMTPAVGAQIGKLQQIADGFVYYHENDVRKHLELHSTKLDVLTEIIESRHGAPTLIVYKFQAELEMMRRRHPGVVMNEHDATEVVGTWNRGEIDNLYVHPQSAGHGINIQFGSNIIVFYGLTWSWDEYEQVIARLRRGGQEAEQVFAHRIRAVNTVDDDIIAAVEGHFDVAETFIGRLKTGEIAT